MQPNQSLEHLVAGVAGAQRHWTTRRQEAAAAPAYTITVAREAGSPGASVAAEVGRRLGWQVYDHELIQKIAEEHNLRASLLESLDERRQSWLVGCMEGFSQQSHVGETRFIRHLKETLLSLAAHGCCVIVGRGAGHVLPPATTLRVRLVAAPEDRVAAIMDRRNLSKHDAARWVETTERERFAFVKEHFQKDPTDPRQYDLILNTSRWSVMECADLILDALGQLTRRAAGAAGGAAAAAP